MRRANAERPRAITAGSDGRGKLKGLQPQYSLRGAAKRVTPSKFKATLQDPGSVVSECIVTTFVAKECKSKKTRARHRSPQPLLERNFGDLAGLALFSTVS